MDAISLLSQDHATITTLFDRWEALGHDGDARRKQELARQVIHELSIHAAIEEQAFYPAVKARDPRLTERINEALEEHRVVKWELAALEGLAPDDARFDAKFAVLVENALLHIAQEENDLFKALRRLFSQEELETMGDALALAKRAAPTHPHPRLPDEPPGNVVVGPVMAVFDRSRDLLAALLERSTGWMQSASRRMRGQTGQLVREGRARATGLGEEAQRWRQEAPGRALNTLMQAREATREASERAGRIASFAASSLTGETRAQPRRKAAGARPAAAARKTSARPAAAARKAGGIAKRVAAAQKRTGAAAEGRVSRRAGGAAGKTARKRSTGQKPGGARTSPRTRSSPKRRS